MEPHAERAGRIELICGCMFSGKSERLLQHLHNAHAHHRSVAVFKHASDIRYARGYIVTHAGQQCEATPIHSAERIMLLARDAELIVVDEGQFFDEELVRICQELARAGKQLVIAGLDRDSWGQPFGPIPSLAAIADVVIRTQAICARCGAMAEYTQRLTPIEGRLMIGGSESYEPRCGRCFVSPPAELRC